MKVLTVFFIIISITQLSWAQDNAQNEKIEQFGHIDYIHESIDEMAKTISMIEGLDESLALEAKSQIAKALKEYPELSAKEVVIKLIKETRRQNMERAQRTTKAHTKLNICEEISGKDLTRNSTFADKYKEDEIDTDPEKPRYLGHLLTVEINAKANLLAKYVEFSLNYGKCKNEIQELMDQGKICQDLGSKLGNQIKSPTNPVRILSTVIGQ